MDRFVVTLLLLLNVLTSRSQDPANTDSLKNCIYHCTESADRFRALLNYTSVSKDYKENLTLLDSALKAKDRSGTLTDSSKMKLYTLLSLNYYKANRFRESIQVNREIRALAGRSADTANLVKANNNLNILYYRLSKPDSSLYFLNANYELLRHSRDTFMIAANLNGLGLYYQNNEEYNKARTYLTRLRKTGEAASGTLRDQILGTVYGNLGMLYVKMEMADSAEYYLDKKLKLVPDDIGAVNELGSLYKRKGELKKALGYYSRAYEEAKASGNLYYLTGSANNMAALYNLLGRHRKALEYASEGEKGAIELERPEWLKISLEEQLVAHREMGNLAMALHLSEQIREVNDSINSQAVQERMAELETTYELKEKTTQLELSKAQNEVQQMQLSRERWKNRLAIALVILVLLIIGVVLIYNQRLRQARRELKEANAIKDRFFAIVAHDMLGGVSAFSGIGPMLEEMADERDYQGIKVISSDLEEESMRVKKMLDDLLQWAFLQLGRINMKPQKLDLETIIAERLKELERSVSIKKAEISLELKEPYACADPGAVTFILRNLLTNALKFSHTGGCITISSSRQNGQVALSVADQGIGMSQKILNRLFNPAEKVSHNGTAGEEGNGLGLILSKEFAERNKGCLMVESTQGKGSVFTVLLPGL